MRLIDADELVKALADNAAKLFDTFNDILSANALIIASPTIEAEPIIRCKDCKYWSEPNMFDSYCRKMSITDNIIYTEPNHYCGFAERKN